MNAFIQSYIARLNQVKKPDNIDDLHGWFWRNRKRMKETVTKANKDLDLKGPYRLKSDLPCLTVGGTKGVLLVSANPGWDQKLNRKEESYARRSVGHYVSLMRDFFSKHPEVVKKRIRWWGRALSCVQLLPNWEERFGRMVGAKRWQEADETKLIGGWELIPFHSAKDGVTSRIMTTQWLKDCATASLKAALRLKPEIVFVASKHGSQLLRQLLKTRDNTSTVGQK